MYIHEQTARRLNDALGPDIHAAWDGDLIAPGEWPVFNVYHHGDDTPFWVEDAGSRFYCYARRGSFSDEIGEATDYHGAASILAAAVAALDLEEA